MVGIHFNVCSVSMTFVSILPLPNADSFRLRSIQDQCWCHLRASLRGCPTLSYRICMHHHQSCQQYRAHCRRSTEEGWRVQPAKDFWSHYSGCRESFDLCRPRAWRARSSEVQGAGRGRALWGYNTPVVQPESATSDSGKGTIGCNNLS